MTAASGADREPCECCGCITDACQCYCCCAAAAADQPDYGCGHPNHGNLMHNCEPTASGADQPTKDQSPHRGNDGGSDRGETSCAGTAIVADQSTLRCKYGHTEAEHWQDGRHSCPTPFVPDQPTLRGQPDDLDTYIAEQRKNPEYRAAEARIVLRGQLAEVIGRHLPTYGAPDSIGCSNGCLAEWEPDHVAGMLLPLIEADRERAVAEGGAEALEQAAARVPRWSPEVIAKWLRDRAAALRGSTGGAR